jgi:methylthioribose-1-phosphate isomerase
MSTRVIVVRRGSHRYRTLLLSLAAGAAVRAGMHFIVSRNLHKRSAALKELEKAFGTTKEIKAKARKTARRVAAGARKDARRVVEHAKNSDVVVMLENDAAALFDKTMDASQRLRRATLKGIKEGKAIVATVPTLPKLAQSWQKVVRSVTRA